MKFGNHLSDGSLDLLKCNFSKVAIISEMLHSRKRLHSGNRLLPHFDNHNSSSTCNMVYLKS